MPPNWNVCKQSVYEFTNDGYVRKNPVTSPFNALFFADNLVGGHRKTDMFMKSEMGRLLESISGQHRVAAVDSFALTEIEIRFSAPVEAIYISG